MKRRRGVRRVLLTCLTALGWLCPEGLDGAPRSFYGTASSIYVHEGRLSLNAQDKSWPEFLRDFERQTGVVLRVLPSPSGTVTASIDSIPIEQAIRQLFGFDASFLFIYHACEPCSEESARPAELWVFGSLRKAPSEDTPRAVGIDISQPESPRPPGTPANDDDQHSVPILLLALRHADADVRREAADTLGDIVDGDSIDHDSVVDALGRLMEQDDDPEVRMSAVSTLATLGSPRAMSALSRAFRDGEPAVRAHAVKTLADLGGERAVRMIRSVFHDGDDEVRSEAATAIEGLLSAER